MFVIYGFYWASLDSFEYLLEKFWPFTCLTQTILYKLQSFAAWSRGHGIHTVQAHPHLGPAARPAAAGPPRQRLGGAGVFQPPLRPGPPGQDGSDRGAGPRQSEGSACFLFFGFVCFVFVSFIARNRRMSSRARWPGPGCPTMSSADAIRATSTLPR